jgi:hypothetical protein
MLGHYPYPKNFKNISQFPNATTITTIIMAAQLNSIQNHLPSLSQNTPNRFRNNNNNLLKLI